jgi:histone deacetylase 11
VIPIVYSSGYNITACGFEKCHPFDSTKYGRIWDFLFKKQILNNEMVFHEPTGLPSRKWLLDIGMS